MLLRKNIQKMLNYFYQMENKNPSDTLLHLAVTNGDIDTVETILRREVDIDAACEDGTTVLHKAIRWYKIELIKLLLSRGANVNAEGEYGQTSLHIAVEAGYIELVELLLKHGAYINSVCTYGGKENCTPLYIAVIRRNKKLVKLLLEHGANVDAQDQAGKTILYFAVEDGCSLIVQYLLKHHPDVNNRSNRSALNVAVHGNGRDYSKIAENLLQYGLTINPEDANTYKLLHTAVSKGYLTIVEELLKYGHDVNMVNYSGPRKGCTPLHVATKNKQEEIAKLLVSYGAGVNAQDETGKTPIFYAVEKNCREIVKLLLRHGANVNTRDKHGRTALHFTALNEHVTSECQLDINVNVEIAKLLLRSGANVNAESETLKVLLEYDTDVNYTIKNCGIPLHIAAEGGKLSIVDVRLKFGADVDSKDYCGRTALRIAAEGGKLSIVDVRLKFGADVDSKDYCGRTALHIAAEGGKLSIVEVLLKFGADVDSKDHCGRTALHIAAESSDQRIVEALLKFGADIHSKDQRGRTALHIACDKGNGYIIIALLEHSCDITIMNSCYEQMLRSCDSDDAYSRNDIPMILNHHAVKVKTANLYASKDLPLISSQDVTCTFQNECEEEIARMKGEKVGNANISFYDILTKKASQLAIYAGNESIVQAFRSGDYEKKFPIYATMINGKFRKGQRRKVVIAQGNQIFHSLFTNFLGIPYDCTEKIFDYLSNEDLRTIMDACKRS
ncbi:uncharacterized protein LOC143377176 [Andrena cerasifolii]|uniref:uncharacterized protein LOC143377176 n=1 Tax=Andrena cerasifolii TaxID=2819439 RepID=UPI0040380CD6